MDPLKRRAEQFRGFFKSIWSPYALPKHSDSDIKDPRYQQSQKTEGPPEVNENSTSTSTYDDTGILKNCPEKLWQWSGYLHHGSSKPTADVVQGCDRSTSSERSSLPVRTVNVDDPDGMISRMMKLPNESIERTFKKMEIMFQSMERMFDSMAKMFESMARVCENVGEMCESMERELESMEKEEIEAFMDDQEDEEERRNMRFFKNFPSDQKYTHDHRKSSKPIKPIDCDANYRRLALKPHYESEADKKTDLPTALIAQPRVTPEYSKMVTFPLFNGEMVAITTRETPEGIEIAAKTMKGGRVVNEVREIVSKNDLPNVDLDFIKRLIDP